MSNVTYDRNSLTATDAAKILGVSDTAIRKRILSGSIRAEKHGREWRIRRDEMARLEHDLRAVSEPGSVATEPPNLDDRTTEPNRTEPPNLSSVAERTTEPLRSVATEPPNLNDRTTEPEFGRDRTTEPNRTEPPNLGSPNELRFAERDDQEAHAGYEHVRSENDMLRRELEFIRDERDEFRSEMKRLHARMEHLEALNERLTLLLANEQAQRMQILPRPMSWFARLFRRQ